MTPSGSSASTCPQCRAPLDQAGPGGLCPACLLEAAGVETQPFWEGPGLSPETLAAAFPQLEILAPLGRGGMGCVYRVRQPHLDRLAALKILPPELARDEVWVERFTREARALARLNHPNIVQIYDVGQTAGADGAPLCWLLMEYVDGVTLRQVLRTGGLSAWEALALVPKLCDALQYAHGKGVLHRDIKPENILLDSAGAVKVADFGLAKLAGSSSTELTGVGVRLGTAAYMAPEQFESPGDVDHRADIYSLGVVLYEMLTGGLPLGRFPAPSEKSGTDPRLDSVVFRTLEKERERRYQEAGEVRTALEEAQKPQKFAPPAAASPAAPRVLLPEAEAEVPAEPARTVPLLAGIILVVLVALLLRGFVSLILLVLVLLLLLLGVWMMMVMNTDSRRGLAAMSGRIQPAGGGQSHGCVAMLAFSLALAAVLAPPAVAVWLMVYRRAEVSWLWIAAGCAALSFILIQPLLRLTGMHRSEGVRRNQANLTAAGLVMLSLGMGGGALLDTVWVPGRPLHTLTWQDKGSYPVKSQEAAANAVKEVFGREAQRVMITVPVPDAKDDGGLCRLTWAGAADPYADERLLLSIAMARGRLPIADVRLDSSRPGEVNGVDAHWYALPFLLAAGGGWIAGILARPQRRWIPSTVLGVVLTGGALALRAWQPVLPGLYPLIGASEESGRPAANADLELQEERTGPSASVVLKWIAAVRAGDDIKAASMEGPHYKEFGAAVQRAAATGRLLSLESSINSGSFIQVECVFAVPSGEQGNHRWVAERFRIILSQEGSDILLNSVSRR